MSIVEDDLHTDHVSSPRAHCLNSLYLHLKILPSYLFMSTLSECASKLTPREYLTWLTVNKLHLAINNLPAKGGSIIMRMICFLF